MTTNLHIGFDREHKDEKIELPLKALKRHFAALGSSGSGKTVLVKCVIEECIRSEVPLIIIDIQGDLASLALMGDKKLVEEKGTPGSYYDDVKNKAQVAIYTPASTKGIAISMNPLKAPPQDLDQEDLIQAIDSVAETVASILKYNVDKGKGLDVKNYLYLLLESIWGSGEEVNSFGELGNKIKNDDEYLDDASRGMLEDKDKDELIKNVKRLTIGSDSLIFNMGISLDIERMMTWADEGKTPVNVLYLNTIRDADDRVSFIANTATQIYNWMLKNPSENVQLMFILDELAGLVPPTRNPPSKKSIQLLLKQARKYGVSLLLATQNISDVDYKSLGQVGTWALGRLMAKQDIEKVRDIIQSISPKETDKILSVLSVQKTGQFVLLAPDVFKEVRMIRARWLVTDHKTLDDAKVKLAMDESGIREKFPDAVVKRTKKRSTKKKVEEEELDDSAEVDDTGSENPAEEEVLDLDVSEVPDLNDSETVLSVLDDRPLALSAQEISEIAGVKAESILDDVEKLVKDKKLSSTEVNGVKVYWSSKYKMDPKKNIVGAIFRIHVEKRQAVAEKIMKHHIPKTLGIRALEDIIDDETDMFYMPLWRVGVLKTKRSKKKVVREKTFQYVNGLTGEITVFDPKETTIDFKTRIKDLKKLTTLPQNVILEAEVLDGLKKNDYDPKLNREDALDQITKLLAMRIDRNISPSLVYLPVWQFTLVDKDTNDERKGWVDACFGTYIKDNPFK